MKTPDYINQNWKPMTKDQKMALKKRLKEMQEEFESRERADRIFTAEALRSGFYCTGGRSNIQPLI